MTIDPMPALTAYAGYFAADGRFSITLAINLNFLLALLDPRFNLD